MHVTSTIACKMSDSNIDRQIAKFNYTILSHIIDERIMG